MELIRARVQYASRQQCCKTHKRPLPLTAFITEKESVYCVVRAEYLNIIQVVSALKVKCGLGFIHFFKCLTQTYRDEGQ